MRYGLRNCPEGVDRRALARWLARNDVDYADWLAYAAEVERTGGDLLAYGVTMPRDFHDARRRLQEQIRAEERRSEAEKEKALMKSAKRINALLRKAAARLGARVRGFTVIIPTTREEFREEGNAMKNCIAGYFEAHARGERICAFIRRNGERVADMETNRRGQVLQCRAVCNAEAPAEVQEYAQEVAKTIAAVFRRKSA